MSEREAASSGAGVALIAARIRSAIARYRRDAQPGGRMVMAFAMGLFLAMAALVSLGYVATREWRRGTEQIRQRRAAEALALADAALSRDMKGAWASLIAPINHFTIEEEPPYDLLHQAAQTFATFPYPESFIVWKDDGRSPRTYVFNRADRQPHWDNSTLSDDPFPVVLLRDPAGLRPVIETARLEAASRSAFVMFQCMLGGRPYQVVAHMIFSSTQPHALVGMAAFTVNLDWVRQNYFGPLLSQVARIGGHAEALSLAVSDDTGQLVATSGAPAADRDPRTITRPFPLLFSDPGVVIRSPAKRAIVKDWALHVRPSRDDAVQAVARGANQLLALMAVAAAASMIALMQTVRAVRASARLASMKSDFVSAVTHELKTPLALIRLVGDTLAQGRYSSRDAVQEYARLLSQETARLGQSIDNLLTYAKYTEADTRPLTSLPPIDVADVVEDALERFRPTLSERGFQVTSDVPRELPHVMADGRAVTQVVEIVIDNAIKYSDTTRVLAIVGRAEGKHVRITIADRGVGIHKGDLEHVFDRFFRGRNAGDAGSGLGLAIARRILRHYGGDIAVRSSAGVGTEIALTLLATAEL
jgi:signal transduction histidine kinase